MATRPVYWKQVCGRSGGEPRGLLAFREGEAVRRQVVNKSPLSRQGNRCLGTAPSFFIHICIL